MIYIPKKIAERAGLDAPRKDAQSGSYASASAGHSDFASRATKCE